MNIEIQPHFAEGERYPALIGVRVEGDEYETAYVSKGELADALTDNAKLRELVADMWEGYNDPPCEDCPLKDTPTCADCPICAREASVIDRMRELGVDAVGSKFLTAMMNTPSFCV